MVAFNMQVAFLSVNLEMFSVYLLKNLMPHSCKVLAKVVKSFRFGQCTMFSDQGSSCLDV